MNKKTTSDGPCPRIDIVPNKALVDEKVRIRLLGFGPEQPVTVRAWMRDDLDRKWESYATFLTDDGGAVDVSSQKPLSGTYDAVDPMGLFWSMDLDPAETNLSRSPKTELTPTVTTLTAAVGGKTVATATLERLFVAPDVTRIPVREQGLAGTFFQPAGPGPSPGLIVMGGSGGGLQEHRAALLASHGYATLALAYFAFEHLPTVLVNIPLEYFETALNWMQAQDAVRGDKLAVMGASRGGELVLLLGATFPQIKAVVGYVPSGVIWAGVSDKASDRERPSWSYRGTALPYVHNRIPPAQMEELFSQEPIPLTPFFLMNLEDPSALEEATIPVEKINGPVLLISGSDDQMWPSSLMSEMVIERLARHRHPFPYKHLGYDEAGHMIAFPYMPTTRTFSPHPVNKLVYTFGGTAQAYAFANVDSWSQVLAFLEESLWQ